MDTSINSRPLLGNNSESEDFHDDDSSVTVVCRPSSSHILNESINYDDDEQNSIENTTTTDEYDDDTDLLKSSTSIPNDKLSYTYIVFYLLGMTTLLPWNFFITAEDYWMYKFRNVTSNSTTDITPTQATFTSDLSFSASIPNTLFLILNACYGHKIPLTIRMNGSMIVILIVFALNTALVEVNTDQWQNTFFDITISSVVIMNIASAILSGSLFGIGGQFPSEYMTAIVSGQALGGVLTAIMEIITVTFSKSAVSSAFTFFFIGNLLIILSIITYITMARTKFFNFFVSDKLSMKSGRELRTEHHTQPEADFKTVLGKIWLYGFAEWMVFVVTLSVYPALTVLINSESHGNGHPWNDVYFIPVTNYLIFNTGDYLGRIVAGMLEWPNNRPYIVAIMSILRLAFLPPLILCNTNPRHRLPVFIHSDYIFILLMCFFSFTNGYLANIAMIYAPKCVNHREKEMSSSIMAAFLGIGLAFGASISFILVELI